MSSCLVRIVLNERLEGRWASWFAGMELEHVDGSTVLSGEVPDRAALHGLLERVRDLNLSLLRVEVKDSAG
jgi:hypothetical protein